MAKTTSGPAKKTGGSKPAKGRIITPPNASKELPKSFYQQDKAKGKKKSEDPDIQRAQRFNRQRLSAGGIFIPQKR